MGRCDSRPAHGFAHHTVAEAEPKGPASGRLGLPEGVATDSSGNVYVADRNRIQKFTSTGTFIAKWGTYGSGMGQFSSPSDVATDSAGNVYVADSGNNRIQKFTSSGTFITKWGRMASSSNLAADSAGHVYVSEIAGGTLLEATSYFRIQKFTSNGTVIAEWVIDPAEFGLFEPSGNDNDSNDIATDSAGHIYFVDNFNCRISQFTSSGIEVSDWGSKGSAWKQCGHLATDLAGNLYVANSYSIKKFNPDGSFLTEWGSRGAGNGQFRYGAYDVATDSVGNVYVVGKFDNSIQKFTSNGTFITKWGDGSPSRSGHKRKPLIIPTTRRKAFFKPRCDLSRRCRALVTIKSGSRTLARGRYSIPAHGSREVAIALTGAGRKVLARKRRTKAKLTIVDIHTRKQETLPVILRRR